MCSIYTPSGQPFHKIVPLAFLGMVVLLPVMNGILSIGPSAFASVTSIQWQGSGKPASPHVGAAMAVLATLEQAHVLPPEGTTEADRIIKSVIQLQSFFTKNTDHSVQEFLRQAVASKHGEQTTRILSQFHSGGWTSDVLEALADGALRIPAEELATLEPGLASVNLSVDDLQHFMLLLRDGEQALASNGRSFHEVFASIRKTMPGAAGRQTY